MNRLIRFRGQRIDSNMWVYGYYHFYFKAQEYAIRCDSSMGYFVDNVILVKPETVGQFTGLCDKDGIDIYEGDIIKGKTFSGGENISFVVYNNEYGCYQLQIGGDKTFSIPINSFNKELEVIGNIYENPELLNK
jgi:uncharacterized phage protein (TIGR01671 family)